MSSWVLLYLSQWQNNPHYFSRLVSRSKLWFSHILHPIHPEVWSVLRPKPSMTFPPSVFTLAEQNSAHGVICLVGCTISQCPISVLALRMQFPSSGPAYFFFFVKPLITLLLPEISQGFPSHRESSVSYPGLGGAAFPAKVFITSRFRPYSLSISGTPCSFCVGPSCWLIFFPDPETVILKPDSRYFLERSFLTRLSR